MISGALFLKTEKKVTIKSIYTKLIPRLAIPYFFWWVFYVVVWLVFSYFVPQLLLNKINHWLPPIHLWYLPMLMGIYMVLPFLKLIVADRKIYGYFLLLWFIFAIFQSIPALDAFYTAFRMHFVIGYVGYYLLGYYVSTIELNRNKRLLIYFIGLFAAIANVVQNMAVNFWNLLENPIIDSYPLLILLAVAIFVWFKYRDWTRFSVLFSKVSPCLFGVYLIHSLWVSLFTKEPFYSMLHPIINIPLYVLTIFLLSYGCTFIIRKIPVLRKVVE